MNPKELAVVCQRLEEAERVLVLSHIRPDGDAVGSMLSFGLALQEAGKDVQMVLPDGATSRFKYLKGYDQISRKPEGEFDLAVVVDCGDLDRVGPVKDALVDIEVVNIDHHVSNTKFGNYNLVDGKAVSVTEMLVSILPACGLEISVPVAEALMTGLITDTQGFRTMNMSPETFRVAAKLFEAGIDLPRIYHLALTSKTYSSVMYWGSGLAKMARDEGLVWAELSLEARKASGYNGRDDADLVQLLASVKDADIAMIFIEQADEQVKVSWRAANGVDVSKIAQHFGGGGHVAASGATVAGGLEEVRDSVVKYTKEYLTKS
jgi:phosphoesterase RecJ-like protein